MPLMAAITAHDVEETRRLLTAGADVNTRDGKITLMEDGREVKLPSCPLLLAVIERDNAIVQALLDAGARPCLPCDKRTLPCPVPTAMLTHAVENGDKEIVQYLFEAGADIEWILNGGVGTYGSFQRNALTNPHLLDIFVQQGADVNRPDADGNAVLHNALFNLGQDHDVERLTAHGADVNLPNTRTGTTPLMLAIKMKSTQSVIELLLMKGADLDCRDSKRRNALHWAAKTANYWALCRLIQENIDLESKRNYHLGQLTTFEYLCKICRRHLVNNYYGWMKPFQCLRVMNILMKAGAKLSLCGETQPAEELLWFRERSELMYQKPCPSLIRRGFEMKGVHIEEIRSILMTLLWKCSNVDSLRHLCRLKIRMILKCDFRERLQMLSLPGVLYEYILMKDLLFLVP